MWRRDASAQRAVGSGIAAAARPRNRASALSPRRAQRRRAARLARGQVLTPAAAYCEQPTGRAPYIHFSLLNVVLSDSVDGYPRAMLILSTVCSFLRLNLLTISLHTVWGFCGQDALRFMPPLFVFRHRYSLWFSKKRWTVVAFGLRLLSLPIISFLL